MSVKTEPSGRRSVALEFEVPGTPEQVWHAIATGPGITSWFVPSEVEEREGGAVVFHLGPDMDSSGHVTAWRPPHRFAYEETDWMEGAPPLATEFIIEARGGGACTVRLVHSLFASGDDWDDQLESMEKGWPPFFQVLTLYLTHFAGLRGASIRPTTGYSGAEREAWDALLNKLGLTGASAGERRTTPGDGMSPLSGVVERIGEETNHRELTLRLEKPAPGIALIGTYTWGGNVQVAVSLYFYGDEAETTSAREQPRWQAWLKENFSS